MMKILRITLEGKSYEVGVEVLEAAGPSFAMAASVSAPPLQQVQTASPAPAVKSVPADEGCRTVASPMAGLVFKCLVKAGDVVAPNQIVIVLDAMKMETPVYAPLAGTVRTVLVKEGDAVDEGSALIQIEGLSQ